MLLLLEFMWSLRIPLIPLILAASILMMPKHGTHLLYHGWLLRLMGLTIGSYIFLALIPYLWKVYIAVAIVLGFWRWRQYWILYEKLSRQLPIESIQSVPNLAALANDPPSPELGPQSTSNEPATKDMPKPPSKEFRQGVKRSRSVVSAIADVKSRALSGLTHPCLNHQMTTRDGINLHYQTIGEGSKLIVVGNGLGGRIYYWEPIIKLMNQKEMYNDYTLITWDYRGLFESSNPTIPGRQSVRDNAEDVIDLLTHFKRGRSDTTPQKISLFLGWSTGVQVGLELVCLYPTLVEKLVLLNGSHGHALQSALQPVFRIPWLGGIFHDLLTLARTRLVFLFGPIAKWISSHPNEIRKCTRVYAMLYGNPHMEWMLLQYITDILGISESHTKNYLKIFQTLDAHSCQHLLPEITTQTLVICGMLDSLTPAYQSYEMAKQMPNARVSCYTLSSHFTILEFPHAVSNEILSFMFEGLPTPPTEPWPVASAIPVPTAKTSGAEVPLKQE